MSWIRPWDIDTLDHCLIIWRTQFWGPSMFLDQHGVWPCYATGRTGLIISCHLTTMMAVVTGPEISVLMGERVQSQFDYIRQ